MNINSKSMNISPRLKAPIRNKNILLLLLLLLFICGTLILTAVLYDIHRLSDICSVIPASNTIPELKDSSNTSSEQQQQQQHELVLGLRSVHTKEWNDWPAIAYEESGHALVTKGDSFFNHARELYFQEIKQVDTVSTSTTHENDTNHNNKKQTLMDEFLQVYKNRPDPINLCGIRINHALALFLAVKQIKPSLVVESGVNAGVSTYFIRAASSKTKIFAIDPLEKPICNQGDRWIDSSDKTTYFTGDTFVDLMDLDWKGMVARREIDPARTLIFLDDHLHAFERVASVMKYGVRHVIVEDNYKMGEGATFNDKMSTPKQMFYGKQYETEGNWLFANLVAYAEFPPIVPPIMAKSYTGERKKAGGFMVASDQNLDIVHPILRPDLNPQDKETFLHIATYLDIDPTLQDNLSYMQFMNYNQICHLELLPVPKSLLYKYSIGG